MPTFIYEARDRQGRAVRGEMDGPNESAVAAEVREQGLFVQRIRPVRQSPVKGRESLLANMLPPVGVKQRMLFWRQLHAAVESGMSISEGVQMAGGRSSSHLGRIASEAARRIAGGEALSSVLAEYPASFPKAEVALVRAGEHSGTTASSIESLAAMNEEELELRRMYMFQSAYPVLVLVLAAFVLALTWSGPSGMIGIMRRYYVPIIVALVGLFFGLRALLSASGPFKIAWDHAKLRMPGFGALVSRLASAKAASIIAAGYRSGLDIASALDFAADSCGNASMGNRIRQAVPLIRGGESVTAALGRTGALPARALQFMETGERTGNIDGMMNSLSRYSREEAIAALKVSAVVLGVIALIVAGAVVLVIALRFYGGLFGGMVEGA